MLFRSWVPTLPTYASRIDLPSVLISFAAMIGIVFTIQQGPALGWPGWIWGLLGAGLVLLLLFLRLQATADRRGTQPLLPLVIFRNRNYSLGSFAIATMGFTVSSMMLPIMIWLQDARGLGAEQAGLMMAPMAAVALVLSPLVGPLADRFHPRVLSMLGFGLMAVALLSAWAIMRSDVTTGWFALAALLMGVGSSFVWAPTSATSMRDVDLAHMGAASGVYNTTRQTGAVLGAAAVGAAMQIGTARAGLSDGMADALLLPAVVLGLGLLAVAFFRADMDPAGHRAGD